MMGQLDVRTGTSDSGGQSREQHLEVTSPKNQQVKNKYETLWASVKTIVGVGGLLLTLLKTGLFGTVNQL